jgi:hypothetical protein
MELDRFRITLPGLREAACPLRGGAMSGWVIATSRCFGCGRLFGYNPHRVPSIQIDPATHQWSANGVREPICRECVQRVNPQRVANGLPEIVIYADSYEPIPEGEL